MNYQIVIEYQIFRTRVKHFVFWRRIYKIEYYLAKM